MGGKSPSGKSIEIQGGWAGRSLELLEPTRATDLSPQWRETDGWDSPSK